ncbi:MAG: sulfotransferase [Actinobacteria bacterium]|nr:MAG: sulfotransferase [Actinomycetota bacterium]
MTMPNFLVIGAGKAGTTSLYYYLDQHPEVYMSPVKEPKFFALEGGVPDYRGPGDREVWSSGTNRAISDPREYEALFDGVSGEKAIGEASPGYLCNAGVPGRIKRYVPDVRLVAVLRDPAERAYSAYLHMLRDGREQLGFAEALGEEERRTREGWAPGWQYTREGFYYRNLKRYFELFDRGRIRIYLYEELRADPLGLMREVFGFLGVDEAFVPDISMRHNASGIPKSALLVSLITRRNPLKTVLKPLLPKGLRRRISVGIQNRNLTPAPPLPPEVRKELVELYREDILALQDLIGRDLSKWLETPEAGGEGRKG